MSGLPTSWEEKVVVLSEKEKSERYARIKKEMIANAKEAGVLADAIKTVRYIEGDKDAVKFAVILLEEEHSRAIERVGLGAEAVRDLLPEFFDLALKQGSLS